MRKIVKLSVFALASFLLMWILIAVLTHGYSWSTKEWKFHHLLDSLPEPPGWRPETDWIDAGGPPFGAGDRGYEGNGQHSEVVDFFETELPLTGWYQLQERESFFKSKGRPGTHNHSTELLFSLQERHCLHIGILTTSDEQGVQMGERFVVSIGISEKENCTW